MKNREINNKIKIKILFEYMKWEIYLLRLRLLISFLRYD